MVASKPELAFAQRPLGIDVSSYQGGGINWSQVKGGGYVFAWTKATEGTGYIDADFTINEQNGKAAGVYMGAYHYCHPELNAPSSEISYFWDEAGSYIKADGLTLMPMLDVEGQSFSGHVGASSLAAWVTSWCDGVSNNASLNGVFIKPTVYISACNAGYLDSSVAPLGSDIANYGSSDGTADPQTGTPWSSCSADDVWGSGVWSFWQYESTNYSGVPGVSGISIDCDTFNGSASGLFNGEVAYATASGGVFWYWDPQGTSGNPTSASWEGNNWSTSPSGQASPVGWTEGKCCILAINSSSSTPQLTITMNSSHTVAGFFDGGVNSINGCNVIITGSGIISMAAGPQGIDVPNTYDILNISNVLAGTGQVVPQGSGSLYLNGTNTYNGGTQLGYSGSLFNGTLYFNNGSAFGSGAIVSSNGFGCTLSLEGSAAVTVPNSWTIPVASSIYFSANPAGLTFSGPWTLNNSLIISTTGAANDLVTISGPIGGGGAFLQKTNVGILALSGTNTYSGTTSIANGTLNITGSGDLGSGNYTATITNNGTLIYSSTASQSFSGVISGTGSLTTSNAGVLTLSAANTFTGGTTVTSGSTLDISTDGALGNSTNSLTLNGGCLKNNNSAPTVTSSRTITLGANGGYIDAGWAPSNTVTLDAKITGSGSLLIDMDGSPVVLASSANNYTGNTIIGTNGPGWYATGSEALLKLGGSTVIPNGSGKGNVYIYSAYKGILDLAGFSPTINGLSGDGVVENSGINATFSVGNNNQTSTFNGVIQNGTGALSLLKTGTGTLTLNGTNTYTAPTTLDAGTLALGATGSISNTSVINVMAGATFDVSAIPSFALSSANSFTASGTATHAVLNGASGGTVNFGAQHITIIYDGSHPALTIPQGQLVLNGNSFTVNGSVLPVGSYTLIQQASGSVSASGMFAVSGTAIGAGTTGSISVGAGNVNLVIKTTPSFSNLTASPTITYGTTSLTLGGKVSAAGPIYPASGETITVTVNSNAQNTTVSDSTGDFSINYNPSTIPVSSNAYTITYSYGGDAALTAASDSSKTLTVNPRPASLSGTRPYDGTATASASILSVANKVGSDVVTVASGSGTLASTNVGTQAITSFGNLALGGAAVGNYTLIGATGSVIIIAPPFSISSASVDSTGSNFIITWQSAPGATYQVLGTGDLNLPWTNVGPPIMATGAITSATNAITSSAGFFNVTGH